MTRTPTQAAWPRKSWRCFPRTATNLQRYNGTTQNNHIMNTALLKTVTLGVAAALAATALGQNENPDEAEIRRLQRRQQEAWNQHDAKAYASLFTEDGDIVNVVGWWWKGRTEIEKKLTDAYAFVFKESVLTITDVDVKFPAPGMAIAHVRWTMVGARTPEGFPKPQQGIQTQLLQRQKGKWLIIAFQNTNALPEIPFPQGPSTSAPQTSATP